MAPLKKRRVSSTSIRTNRVIATIRLSDIFEEVAKDDDSPKWVQVTAEGNYSGYQGGSNPFAFTRSSLETMVKNIREHPAYEVDETGRPVGRVIPWDFNHASEADPTFGDLPAKGAPAQGWTLDLEVRNGPDGRAQLWALTEFLEPARTYVRAGQYQWASVAVILNAMDAAGRTVGPTVSSIALTNTPFIEGMEKLVASKAGVPDATLRRTYWDPARNAMDALAQMRELFALPETSGVDEVMRQLMTVQGWLESGTAPLGTDPVYLTSALRTILNMPALSSDIQVIEEAGKAIRALIDQAATVGAVLPPADSAPNPEVAASRRKDRTMELKVVASKLGVRESDEAVASAIEELVALRNALKVIYQLSRDTNEILITAAKESVAAKARLVEIAAALGVEDPEAAVARLAETIQNAAKIKEIMPELESLRSEKKKREEIEAEVEVDQAIAAAKLPSSVRAALLLHRRHDPEGFRKEHGVGPGAKSSAPVVSASPVAPEVRAMLTNRSVSAQPFQTGEVINLSRYPGANATARAKAYLASITANWSSLSNEDQWTMAVNLRKQKHVIDQPSG